MNACMRLSNAHLPKPERSIDADLKAGESSKKAVIVITRVTEVLPVVTTPMS